MHLQESQTLKYLLKHMMEKVILYFSKIIIVVNKGDTCGFTCITDEVYDSTILHSYSKISIGARI
jgi:hypothetical protein